MFLKRPLQCHNGAGSGKGENEQTGPVAGVNPQPLQAQKPEQI